MDMSSATKLELERAEQASARDASGPRQNPVRILFVHCSAADVQRYLHELERVRFTVSSDVVLTPEQFTERLRSRCFDLILAEYPSVGSQETQVLELLEQLKKDTPSSYWFTA